MLFKSDPPEKTGWYWAAQNEYPIPTPVFYQCYLERDKFFSWGRESDVKDWAGHILWGDEIVIPTFEV